MDAPVATGTRRHGRWRTAADIALIAALVSPQAVAAASQDVAAVKAAFLYNFAKFTEWPALPPGTTIILCIVGDEPIADALVATVRNQNISGHALDVLRPQDIATWRKCHLLFIGDAEVQRSAAGLGGLKGTPVLTVSDGKGFVNAGGMIELYVEGGRMRFAIKLEAAEAAGLRLSSRLLELAKIVRTGNAD
jgi:hypothetical protein